MWDLIVSVPDHCLNFYLTLPKLGTPKHYQGNFTKAVIIKQVGNMSILYH